MIPIRTKDDPTVEARPHVEGTATEPVKPHVERTAAELAQERKNNDARLLDKPIVESKPAGERTVAELAQERKDNDARWLAKMSPEERENLRREEEARINGPQVAEKFKLPKWEDVAGAIGMSEADIQAKFAALRTIYPEYGAWLNAANAWLTQKLTEMVPRARHAFLEAAKAFRTGKGPTRGSGIDLA